MGKIVKTISRLERKRLSANGNPRFEVHFTDGESLPTMEDASINYGLENPEYRDVPVEFTVERGQITYAKPVSELERGN